MSQQGLHPSKNWLIPFLVSLRGEKVQVIMKLKPALTKAGQGVLTRGGLYSAVKERSLLILHLTHQLGCGEI